MVVSLHSRYMACALATIAAACFSIVFARAQSVNTRQSRPAGLPAEAERMPLLSGTDLDVYRDARTLWLVPTQRSLETRSIKIPRLCAPIRSLRWQDDADRDLKFVPEPGEWLFSWKADIDADAMIQVELDGDPLLPDQCTPATSAGDGSVMLLADQAVTVGEKLRFEPQWYKNTVGYWAVATDYVTWQLRIDAAGDYSVAVLQGCGEGQGGSDALITVRDGEATVAELPFQTVDTGHFQNFRWNHLGNLKIMSPGEYQLRIDAKKISKAALFDVRAIHLVKQAK